MRHLSVACAAAIDQLDRVRAIGDVDAIGRIERQESQYVRDYTRRKPFGLVPPLLQHPKPLGLPATLPVIACVSNQPFADDGDGLVSMLCQIKKAAMGSAGILP